MKFATVQRFSRISVDIEETKAQYPQFTHNQKAGIKLKRTVDKFLQLEDLFHPFSPQLKNKRGTGTATCFSYTSLHQKFSRGVLPG